MSEFAIKLAQFEERCRQAGFALTVQRRVVYEAMLQRDDHPTVDQVCETVQERLPEVSRATVYRTLEALVELGVIRRAHHAGTAVRFDSNIHHHHHLICTQCQRIVDFDDARLEGLPMPEPATTGFRVDDYSIHVSGLCADCQAAPSPSSGSEAAPAAP
jgi:Fur family peroxide stress response transcriptional regulator